MSMKLDLRQPTTKADEIKKIEYLARTLEKYVEKIEKGESLTRAENFYFLSIVRGVAVKMNRQPELFASTPNKIKFNKTDILIEFYLLVIQEKLTNEQAFDKLYQKYEISDETIKKYIKDDNKNGGAIKKFCSIEESQE